MLRNALLVLAVAAMLLGTVTGCKKSEPEATSSEAAKTMEDYEAEAREEITTETMDEELGKLEKEIDAEASQP